MCTYVCVCVHVYDESVYVMRVTCMSAPGAQASLQGRSVFISRTYAYDERMCT